MYKINSELPLVWRTPTSLQIGVDNPRVVLPKIYPAEERLLTALRAGIANVSLPAVAAECGVTEAESTALIAALSPSFIEPPRTPSLRIAVDGTGPLVDTLGILLIGAGHRVVRASATVGGKTDLAIVVGEFALYPHRPSGWLSRDLPHLPVVFSDESVRIGPLLGSRPQPGDSLADYPCEQCIELTHRDEDKCWVAMMSQLAGTPAPSQTPLLNAEVSSLIARWVHTPQSQPITSNKGVRIDSHTGVTEVLTFSLHPDCACQALPRNVSVLGSSHGQFPAVPMTRRAASSRE